MTEFEICQEYLQAKSRVKQIKVLADLCQTSPKEIRKILEANGVLNAVERSAMTRAAVRKSWLPEDDARLLELRAEGKTHAQIAILLDRTETACCQRVHNLKA